MTEAQMMDAGFSLDKIPRYEHLLHLWSDGLLFWWHKHGELPTALQLSEDMFDEWDDPVSEDECQRILDYLTA